MRRSPDVQAALDRVKARHQALHAVPNGKTAKSNGGLRHSSGASNGQAAVKADAGAALKVITAAPFVWIDPATLPPRQWLYGRHLIRQFCSTTFAAGGIGKTSLVIAEALAQVTQRPLLGERVHERCRVWLWNGEDPVEELQRRIIAACIHYDISPEAIAGRLFVDSGRDQAIVIVNASREGLEVAEPVIEQVIETIHRNSIDVMVVDPFVTTHRVPENDNMAIDQAVRQWARIAHETRAAIDLVHHLRKGAPGQDERTVEDGRGAVALLSAVRSARVLNQMSKSEAAQVGISKPRSFFRIENGKANLAPPADDAVWCQMVNHRLPNGDDVGVVTPWKWPDPLDGITVRNLLAVQQRIAAGRWRENSQARDWVGKAVAETLGLQIGNSQDKAKVQGLLKQWLQSGALKVVDGEDDKRNRRQFVVVGDWADG